MKRRKLSRREKYLKVKNVKNNNMPSELRKRLGRLSMKAVNTMIK
jgi:hypothetical protein